jgi:hypothetical protein
MSYCMELIENCTTAERERDRQRQRERFQLVIKNSCGRVGRREQTGEER